MAELLPHRVGVATYREWDAIAQHYGRRFWQQTAKTDEMMDLARSLTAGAIDDRDRLERLYTHVRETLESVQTKLPQAQIDLVLSDLHSRNRRWDEAIALVSPLQNDHPLSGFLNNNLAWYLACAGRELDHAEYLVRMAMALEDRAGYENTLAVILLQQGHRDAACDMLRNLMDDDRPSVRLANGYFLGLCRWLDGQRNTAVNVWRELAAVDAGKDPAWLYLWQPQPEIDPG